VPEENDKEKRRAFFRYAFHNIYNYTALAGVGAAALLTGDWWLAVVGAAVEGLWMLFAPDSKLLGRLVWEKRWKAEEHKRKEERRKKQLAALGPADWKRCQAILQKKADIERLASENPSFTQSLMADELRKLGQLADDFIELALMASRFEAYVAAVDFGQLERQMRRFEAQIRNARTPSDRELAQKNLDVLLRRKNTLAEIQSSIRKARGQLDLIENTFKLLGDQIMTMRSPQEMAGQLDELIDGVDAVRTSAQETNALISMERSQAFQAVRR